MKYLTCEIQQDHGYLIPIGDVHFGDKSFGKEGKKKLRGYLDWVAERPNAYIFLMGDIFNVAGRNSATSPFESDPKEYEDAVEFFRPYAHRIIGAIDGNHECFDDKTEILTEDGWANYKTINKETVLYTYNQEKDLLEKETPKEIQRYDFDGELVRIKNRHTDLLITDNHRLLFNLSNGKFQTKPFNEVPVSKNRVGFISSGSQNQAEYDIKDDELRILAWLLADGSIYVKRIMFYQRKSKHHLITNILDALEWKYSIRERDRDIKQICGKILKKRPEPSMEMTLLSPFNHRLIELTGGNKKRLPQFIYELSDRQFTVFLNSYIDGDGSRHISCPETSLMIYGEKQIIDDLQRACFLHGYRTSISEYREGDFRLNITKNKTTSFDKFEEYVSKEKYQGVIWDVTTNNDTVIVRRNGKVSITGNSRMYEEFGASPLSFFARELNIPYCKYSAIVKFKVGRRTDSKSSNRYNQIYFGYFHHTTGGGSTVGSKLNRVAKLRNIVEGVDFLCGGHNHQLAVAPQEVYYPTRTGIKIRRIWYVDCGSYLEWNDSYAEKSMLAPAKLGSPRIRLSGKSHHHDVHVSL